MEASIPTTSRSSCSCNTEGRLRLVDGDNVEILPGIRAYTGARHTFASQYIRVDGDPPFVLASDNCYLYRNLAEHKASATFSEADQPANIRNQARMIELAGSADRVVPGHDPDNSKNSPTEGPDARRIRCSSASDADGCTREIAAPAVGAIREALRAGT